MCRAARAEHAAVDAPAQAAVSPLNYNSSNANGMTVAPQDARAVSYPRG